MREPLLNDRVILWGGDCLECLPEMEENYVDSVVTDPPYHLTSIVKRFGADAAAPAKVGKTGAYSRASAGFMGKKWDGGDIAFSPETWALVWRVLKPGGHLVAFAGTRTYHRMTCAIEDAGFEIRDQIGWAYGSGFPKSHDVSKGIDRAAGAEREVVGPNRFAHLNGKTNLNVYGEASRPDATAPATYAARAWQGWGTALKPAWEPICLARKPLIGTVAENVQQWGTGALNIDGCRVAAEERPLIEMDRREMGAAVYNGARDGSLTGSKAAGTTTLGRWPANIVHDGSDEVVKAFPETESNGQKHAFERTPNAVYGDYKNRDCAPREGDTGSAARFFYTAKADSDDRIGSKHPTVKPIDLMQWLVRLVTPPGGVVLDPFAGTGTTAEAAFREGMKAVLIEREEEYQADIRRRMALVLAGPDERLHESIKASGKVADAGPLFDESTWAAMWKEPWIPAE